MSTGGSEADIVKLQTKSFRGDHRSFATFDCTGTIQLGSESPAFFTAATEQPSFQRSDESSGLTAAIPIYVLVHRAIPAGNTCTAAIARATT